MAQILLRRKLESAPKAEAWGLLLPDLFSNSAAAPLVPKNRRKLYAHFGMQIRTLRQVIGLFRCGSGVSGKFELGVSPGGGPLPEGELVETAFNEHRFGLARRRRSYRRNDHCITQI